MSRYVYKSFIWAFAIAIVFGGCAHSSGSQSDPYDEEQSRVYQADYNRLVEMTAQTAVDVGLEVESSGVQNASTYAINTVRKERLAGGAEPIQVAQIEIYLDKLKDGAVRVRIKSEKITRTSTTGTSSAVQRDYARRIFNRLDRRVEGGAPPTS